jgi:hypothetical protein
MLMDDDMVTGLGVLKSTVDLLRLSQKPLVRSKVAESASALMVVESVLADLQDVIDKNAALIALFNDNNEDDDSLRSDTIPRRSPSIPQMRKGTSFRPMSLSNEDVATISAYSKKPEGDTLLAQTSRNALHSSSNHSVIASTSRGGTPRNNPKNRHIAFPQLDNEPSGKPPPPAASSSSTPKDSSNKMRKSSFFGQASLTEKTVSKEEKAKKHPERHMTAEDHEKLKLRRLEQEEEESRNLDMALKAQEAFMILDKDHSGSLDGECL